MFPYVCFTMSNYGCLTVDIATDIFNKLLRAFDDVIVLCDRPV